MDMSGGTRQLSLAFEGEERRTVRRLESRRELRERTVRRVEYTPFPRVGSDTRTRVGFTRDVSASGMALGVDDAFPVGSLLRVIVQQADGRPEFDAVVRVGWCRAGAEPGPDQPPAWLGLVQVAEIRRGMARIPRAGSDALSVAS